jgi:phosphoribosylformimino-5-aminoimidazole carboxamide ribotide isomerase
MKRLHGQPWGPGPAGLQLGGGVTVENASRWIDAGAEAVIVTSWVFHGGRIDFHRLDQLCTAVGREHLVLDLSCRRRGGEYRVVTDRWQTFTDEVVDDRLLDRLSAYCHEYLVHGVDVEGRCSGIEEPLVRLLGSWGRMPVTYAGGIRTREDIALIEKLSAVDGWISRWAALWIFSGAST